MLIFNILNYFRGYLKIKVTGSFLERFINICTNRNIGIWDIQAKGTKVITAKTSIRGYRKLREVCKKTGSRIHILSKKGFPFVFGRFMRRKGLVLGLFLFVVLIAWLCSHIWYIEIADTQSVSKEELRLQLERAGIKPGASIWSINPDKIQAEMLSQNPKLSWLWTDVVGTKVYVDLRERVQKPEIVDTSVPCNIIAKEGGKITDFVVWEGRTLMEKEMWVSKGQLLVGGVMDSTAVGVRFVHADAEVWADTEHALSGQYQLHPVQERQTGNSKSAYGVKFGTNLWNLPFSTTGYKQQKIQREEYPLRVGELYFPISLIKTNYFETIKQQEEVPREQIIAEAKEYLEKTLQNELGNGMIKEKNFTVTELDENTIEVRLEAQCSQQIAEKQPIEGDTKADGGENN